jgi:hypothetical protein
MIGGINRRGPSEVQARARTLLGPNDSLLLCKSGNDWQEKLLALSNLV